MDHQNWNRRPPGVSTVSLKEVMQLSDRELRRTCILIKAKASATPVEHPLQPQYELTFSISAYIWLTLFDRVSKNGTTTLHRRLFQPLPKP